MTPTWTHEKLSLYHADCMEVMRQFPDKHFDLAIVDPPYGIGEHGGKARSGYVLQRNGNKLFVRDGGYQNKNWDNEPPSCEYFAEIRRCSRNQIIWGANHFIDRIPCPSPAWIVWDKVNQGTDQADFEMAWTSFKGAARKFDFMWSGMCQGSPGNGRVMQGNKALNEKRIHPTQKPVALYRWLLAKYAQPGQRILDTHLGSGSHAIAAHYAGMDFTGIELDADYFTAACERIQRETSQMTLGL